MNDLSRAMSFDEDLLPVFDAFSNWCKLKKISPDGPVAAAAVSLLVDFFRDGVGDQTLLLAAIDAKFDSADVRTAA